MRELRCSVHSFRGFLAQFRTRGAELNGGTALPPGVGIRMPSQNRYEESLVMRNYYFTQ